MFFKRLLAAGTPEDVLHDYGYQGMSSWSLSSCPRLVENPSHSRFHGEVVKIQAPQPASQEILSTGIGARSHTCCAPPVSYSDLL